MAIQHLTSSTANKRPTPAAMADAQIAINSNTASPGLFFKDSAGALIKVGPVHVGTTAPNASPASGGQTGNTVGEQWLDTSGGTYVFKVWDGTAWRSEAGEFVNTTGDTMTGALGIIAGSASTPGLFITGDTNTGIYSPGADQVAISTNGTGRLFVGSDGKIGVGAASTGAYLQVYGVTGSSIITAYGADSDGTADLEVKSNGTAGASRIYFSDTAAQSGLIRYSHNTNSMEFSTAGSERMRLDSSGRLGLGTSDPGSFNAVLAVQKNQTADTAIVIDNSGSSGASTTSSFIVADGGATRGWFRRYRDGSGNNGIGFTDALLFEGNIGGTKATRMVIDSSGRVGIGTTGPVSALNIRKDSLGSGGTAESAITLTYSATNYGQHFIDSNGSYVIHADSNGVAGGNLKLWADTSIIFNTASDERARIDSSGRLLVGASSDSGGALLQVNGDRVRIATAKTPASASDTGTTGEICWDANYIYVCTATNTWKRSAISTW